MIRITETSLIIEIPVISETPLEKLSMMQTGLLNLIGIIDFREAPQTEIEDGLWHLRNLLKEMVLTPMQSGQISKGVTACNEFHFQHKKNQ